MGIWLRGQREGVHLTGKNHNKRLKAHVDYHPPPQSEDGPKEAKSKVADDEGTDSKYSTHHILIPTRYLGVSICLKGGG